MSLVNRVRFGTSIDKNLHEKINQLAKTTRIPVSKLTDEAITDLLEKHGVKGQEESVDKLRS